MTQSGGPILKLLMLSSQQKKFFDRLSSHRRRGAELLEQPYMRGVKNSVVEKYSDQAHFIYELLQNADDVKATKARFVLTPTDLIFAHNGKIHFSLTDPETEYQDNQQQKLGHINAITSIGHSNKYKAQIGKFGLGFKAVFQYVQTPEIYDPPFFFRIENFIVPVLLHQDHPERQRGETLFYLPFSGHEQAFQDIFEKLKNLIHPLLYLKNLAEIIWTSHDGHQGRYSKFTKKINLHSSIKVEHLRLEKTVNHKHHLQYLLVLTRPFSLNHEISIAYFMSPTGQILHDQEFPAYCFFPTQKSTKLRFIIQAPFLLTDSREGLKTGAAWNKELVEGLAQLIAESLLILKSMNFLTEEFFYVLPINEHDFPLDHLFRPLYEKPLQQLTSECLLPAQGGEFVTKQNAYLADHHALMNLLNHEQLAHLVNNPHARWVFPNVTENSKLWKYVREHLTIGKITAQEVAAKMSHAFMQQQNDLWLTQLYTYLLEKARYLWNERKGVLRYQPIIRLNDHQMVSPYDQFGNIQVYLPTSQESNYPTVKACLVEDEKSLQFLIELGLDYPKQWEEIKYYLIPRYHKKATHAPSTLLKDFRKLLTYFLECPWSKRKEYLTQIKTLPFCKVHGFKEVPAHQVAPERVYFRTPQLEHFFAYSKHPIYFLDHPFYQACCVEFGLDRVNEFFRELGLQDKPRPLQLTPCLSDEQKHRFHQGQCTYELVSYDYDIEGLDEFIPQVTQEGSILLWNFLLAMICEKFQLSFFEGAYKWFYRKERMYRFPSKFLNTLQSTSWLYDHQGQQVKPHEVTVHELAKEYDVHSDSARFLIEKLNLPKENLPHFTLVQKHKYAVGEEVYQLARSFGKHPEEFLSEIRKLFNHQPHDESKRSPGPTFHGEEAEGTFGALKKKQSWLKEQLQQHIEELSYLETLHQQLSQLEKYSVGWFNTLLDLEYSLESQYKKNNPGIRITFSQLSKEPSGVLILQNPSRQLPAILGEIDEILVKMVYQHDTKSLLVKVVNVQEFAIKVRPKLDLNDVIQVSHAMIELNNPLFISEALRSAFRQLPYSQEYNLQAHLPKDVEFVFGPPGTGKTTYLAKERIIPLMEKQVSLKILVLTPTNQAADVLFKKIMQEVSSPPWLIRFEVTGDSEIEKSGLLKNKHFNIKSLDQCVVVTTLARFIYDGFIPDHRLKDYAWDFIIFDEASMITLAHVVYVLYQKIHCRFIIGGDPFQIPPVVKAKEWQEENIYTLVGLNQFDGLNHLSVTQLTVQYRSIPPLGRLFSEFLYQGRLQHARLLKHRKKLKTPLKLKEINFIRFPVMPAEGIYKVQRLEGGSAYQIYSALLTVELAFYLVKYIQKQSLVPWKIGIICPYAAQAILVEKIISALSSPLSHISLMVGTVHGFQGEECDMIISLLNPPPVIHSNSFLNKENILNVCLSRAKDYLILLVPDLEGLKQINRIKNLIIEHQLTPYFKELTSKEVEKIIFKQDNYLYEHSFVTAHQNINVYSKPSKKYEIRYEENAIDVQLLMTTH